jgi:DNA topoisomerase-1
MMIEAFPPDSDIQHCKLMCEECGDVVSFSFDTPIEEKTCSKGHLVKNRFINNEFSHRDISSDLYCEKCGAKMKLLKGRRGKFYGCTNYPECHFTYPFEKHKK